MNSIDLERERSRIERQWQGRGEYVPLAVAAAVAFHQVHGSTRAIVTPQDYDDALSIAAMALSRLIPIYAMEGPREGRKVLSIDLGKQSFVRGATRLRTGDAIVAAEFSVRRSDLSSAIGVLKRSGMPFLLAPTPAVTSAGPRANRLLAALPDEDLARLAPDLEAIPLRRGEVLYAEGSTLRHVYFPVSGVVSLLYISKDGEPTEIAVVGDDGVVGLAVLLGGGSAPRRAVVQVAGHAHRIRANAVLEEFHRNGPLQSLLLRYVQALMTQIAQTAVCNRHHTVEQQLCRWLLLSLDRVSSNQVLMTQELISQMLGVRRAGVTEAARKLQQLGLISYRRGSVAVPDRKKLEAHACECYSVVKKDADRLLPPDVAARITSP